MYIHNSTSTSKKKMSCVYWPNYISKQTFCPLSEYAPAPIRIITSGEGEKLPESRDREDVISYPLT